MIRTLGKTVNALLCSMLLLFASVSGMLQVAAAAGPNLLANPSVEEGTTSPTAWSNNKWGTNTASFTYNNTGRTGTKSITTKVTAYTNGDAKWSAAAVAVSPTTSYTYSDWYKSNVATNLTIEYANASGALSYVYLGNTPASPTNWAEAKFTFTTPASAAKLRVLHYVSSVGEMTLDDASLVNESATQPGAPSVSLTAPAAGSTVSGDVTLTANATDAQAVTAVQFKVDGNNVGSADTTAPYSVSWDSKTVANGAHTVTAVATNNSNLSTTSSPVNITVANSTSTPPDDPANLIPNPSAETGTTTPTGWGNNTWGTNSASFTYNNTGHTGNRSLTTKVTAYTSGDAKWSPDPVTASPNTTYNFSHWYKSNTPTSLTLAVTATNNAITYFWLGDLPSSTDWRQSNFSFTTPANTAKVKLLHTIQSVGELTVDDYKLSTNATNPPTAPTVSLTAPANNATVSNSVALTANASDAQGVTSVQFKVDGNNIGNADTTAPYSFNWDTKTATNGQHILTAVATNTAGLTATSSPVTVTVNNTVVTPPAGNNLVLNPSFESSASGTSPDSWIASKWGTNSSTFTYQNTGHTGNRSAQVTTTSYSSGAANWFYNGVNITGGKTYQFSDWYKATVDTEVDAEVTMTDGTIQYFWLGSVPASANWAQYKSTFTAPAGAQKVTIYHVLAKVGTLTTDDYSITEYAPQSLGRGIVTITFDDGWANQYTNARTILNNNSLKATYYVLSGETNSNGYMSANQIRTLHNEGNEIGSHSIDHSDFTTLTTSQVTSQFRDSQSALQTIIGAPVTNFAYPYGAYNSNTISIGQQYYASQRSVDRGFNTRDNLNVTKLKIQEVNSQTSNAQVQAWINQAIVDKSWLVLCYHEITTTPAPGDEFYTVTPANFSNQMNYLKNSGVSVQTLKSALAEVQAQ